MTTQKKIIFLLLFICCFCIDCKKEIIKTSTDDSLKHLFETANNDSIEISRRLLATKKALSIVSKQPNDSLNRKNYFKIANRFFNINYLEDYRNITSLIIKHSIAQNDSMSLAKGYDYMVDYYVKKFEADSAYLFNYKAEKIYRKLKNDYQLGRCLLNKAVYLHNESDFLNCERTVFEALKKLRTSEDINLIYEANNLLGLIYSELAEFELSKKYYNKTLVIVQNKNIPTEYHLKAVTLNNLGLLYRNQNLDNQALKYYISGLNEENLKKDKPYVYATLLDNFAYSTFKDQTDQNVLPILLKALQIKDSLHAISGMITNKLHLSEVYIFKKDTTKSFEQAHNAYILAKQHHEHRDILTTLQQLSKVDPKNALKYSEEYYKINDSLQIKERKARNKFARIEFETDELATEKANLIEQRKTLVYIALGIILIGVFIFVIRFQAAKNRELLLIQEQQQANEEIYQLMLNQQNKIEEVRQLEKKRIAQELHDGVLGKLFGTRLNLGVLNSKKDDAAITERTSYIDELKNLEQEIREISHDLNSEKTAVFNNFVVMVNQFVQSQQNVCQATISLAIDPQIEWSHVADTAKINLYRILQEAFQNINKYANAKTVAITFEQLGSLVVLKVRDDGAGFNAGRKKKGIGLLNMESRIKSSGGQMSVETAPGKGTLLRFEIPQTQNTINLPQHEKNFTGVNG